MPNRKPTHLYWVETQDHDEDCFIIANSERSACRFHEDHEGYDRGDSAAQLVTSDVPNNFALTRYSADWAPNELLQAIGARLLSLGNEEVVQFNSRAFWLGSFAPGPFGSEEPH